METAVAGGDSEREIENSQLVVSMEDDDIVFLFLANTEEGNKLSCRSGVASWASTGDGRRLRHASSDGVAEALGSTCFCR
jgi:hypothetical protein